MPVVADLVPTRSRIVQRLMLAAALLIAPAVAQTPLSFPTPPQDQGLPYTRSAHPRALKAIDTTIAVFGGSRYAYLYGKKVRLDDTNMLHAEAVFHDNKLFVPRAFAAALSLKTFTPAPGLPYLADKWVYSFPRAASSIPASIPTLDVDGGSYISLGDLAESKGLHTLLTRRGLLLVSSATIAYADTDPILSDDIVTLFDTPEKLADPTILIHYVPVPHSQGEWYEHASTTPEQMAQLAQPEVKFPLTPKSAYIYDGIDTTLFGSKVPPPGVWPRVIMSPEDVPALAARVKASKFAQMSMIDIEEQFKRSWWDTSTNDGRFFKKLYTNDIADLKFDRGNVVGPFVPYASGNLFVGYKPTLYNSHISYITNSLVTMSLYALLTNDDELGRKCATAVSNFYKILEPTLDEAIAMTNSELGADRRSAVSAEDSFRGLHGLVEHMDLGLSLDMAGKWMTPAQVEVMRRFIAKATYGRRVYGGEAPSRWRDNNQVTWHTTNVLAQMAIEGLPGYDPEVYASGLETVRSFLEFGIDANGQFYESNGKTGGGNQFLFLNMLAMARRGEDFFGHPHLRKVFDAEVYNIAPNGAAEVSGGTYGGGRMSAQFIMELATVYPSHRAADYLLTGPYAGFGPSNGTAVPADGLDLRTLDLKQYRQYVIANWNKRMRTPGPTYPGFIRAFPFCRDFVPTTRAELNLPLDHQDSIHGTFSAYSDQTPDAAWMDMLVRPNHYLGAGHHHADAGMFYFAGAGVNWITESPFVLSYDGRLHNEVLIDGIAEANGTPARAKYLGATLSPAADFASADLSYAYSWEWTTQMQEWGHTWPPHTPEPPRWELEPAADIIAIFQGTQRYKNRIWWDTYNFANWIPTLRAPWNPVEYAYRTTGLVRGKHPYGIVVDDLKKDSATHLYQWAAMLSEPMVAVSLPSTGPDDLVLARKADATGTGQPKSGTPLLLLHMSGPATGLRPRIEMANDGPADRNGKVEPYPRIVVDDKATEFHERTLLVPFHMGDPLPTFTQSPTTLALKWPDETSTLNVSTGIDHRTHVLPATSRAGR
jgi:hypothetical protein